MSEGPVNVCTLPADYEPNWREIYPLTEYGKMMIAARCAGYRQKPKRPSWWSRLKQRLQRSRIWSKVFP